MNLNISDSRDWEDQLQEFLSQYIGRHVKDEFLGEYDDQIELEVVDRPYCDPDDEDYDEDADEGWTITHYVTVNVDDDHMIEEFWIESRVWGDSGLGDIDPSIEFSEYEYFDKAIEAVEEIIDETMVLR